MAKKNQLVNQLLERWRTDLRELFSGVSRDPFVKGQGRRWDRDFTGEVGPADTAYAVFIVLLSLIPAAAVAYVSKEPQWKMFANLFGAPMQAVISGFLTASLIFLGSHVNRVPKPWPVAFKLMLRIMAAHPLLCLFNFSHYGAVLVVLGHGFLVVRGVRKTYPIPMQNVFLFFGVIYIVFALFQLQTLMAPLPADPVQKYSLLYYGSLFAA